MDSTSNQLEKRSKNRLDSTADRLRSEIRNHSKSFKTSWVNLGQALYGVWQDRLYYAWGYDKFEHYIEREVGLPKQLSVKLLKSYFFLEQEEPSYLKRDFQNNREAIQVPGLDAVNVLRLAKNNRELPRNDYMKLRKDVFEKGRDAAMVRRDLTAMIKERKPSDPIEERNKRKDTALRNLIHSLDSFQKDMSALKLVPDEIVKDAQALQNKLEEQF